MLDQPPSLESMASSFLLMCIFLNAPLAPLCSTLCRCHLCPSGSPGSFHVSLRPPPTPTRTSFLSPSLAPSILRSLAPSRLQHIPCQHTPNPAVSHAPTDHRNAGKSIGVDFKMASGIGAPAFGKDRLEMHEDALRTGAKVLIIDDMLGTGTPPLFPPSSSTEGTNPSLTLCSALARRCIPSTSSPPASNVDEIAALDRFRLRRNPKA